ncbi:MAG: hypothetical protein FWD24_03825 [Treponema sp.]|nr:hypothetical protein [Treponema sp.]
MSDVTYGNALQSVANNCSYLRMKKLCKEKFGDHRCVNCKHYIGNYTDAAQSQLNLFMYQVDINVGMVKHRSKQDKSTALIVILILAAFFGLLLWAQVRPDSGLIGKSWLGDLKARSMGIENLSSQQYADEHKDIQDTLQKVANDLNRKVDVNGDKLINCIDAAVLFYQYYPDRSKVRIMWNLNHNTGMNHLFNAVLIKGTWTSIEPQAKWNNHSHWMPDVWGSQYDPKKNVDATQIYLKYVK